jgi:aminoglycoside phosphotransferase (APT) family kinase protein
MSGGDHVPPTAALAAFGPAVLGASWARRGGGFSGAAVFAGSFPPADSPRLCLKAWPAGAMSPDHLTTIHRWVAQVVRHPFVPRVHRTTAGRTWAEADGRVWELTTWLPGAADFRDRPTPARLANACKAVAALHAAWRPAAPAFAPFPAVERRLALLRDWRDRPARRGRLDPDLVAVAARAAAALKSHAADAERRLAPWAGRHVAVQPCLCDVHHDHVLFTGDAVTGVIDYGAMKPDHPAVDLARLLGDLAGDDPGRVRRGLDAYHTAGGSADVTAELVGLLDRTGTACAAANWLLRLAAGPPADPAAVAVRLDRLVRRLERDFAPAGRIPAGPGKRGF